ncbi:MAG: phage tail tape measure protein [Actinobacteria bacterium]|nr:phage tail tape measure protein [Actinomycetota bacterium]
MQLHFTATGDLKGLQSNLQAVNKQANQSMQGVGQAAIRVQGPLNDLQRSLTTTGKLTGKQWNAARKNMVPIIRESKAMERAVGQSFKQMDGSAKVYMGTQKALGSQAVTTAMKMKFLMTTTRAVGKQMIATGKNMQWAGRQVTVGLTVPLALIGRKAYQAAEQYNENFTRILKVNNEASAAAAGTAEAFDMISDSIRRQTDRLAEMGASMGFMAEETTNMVAELSQMGYAGISLDQLSESAMRLSRTAGTDLTTSLELARLTAQAFNVPLEKLDETFARLNLVENNTALSLDELSQAMPVVAGVAATMGVSIEETAGLLAMMKENGIGANEGATALRTGLLRIVQNATDPAIEAFAKINLNLEEMQERMARGNEDFEAGDIMIFFDELSERLNEMGDNQDQLNEFAAAVSKMVGVRSSARFLSFLSEIGDRFDENTVAGRAWMGVMADAEEATRIYQFELDMVQQSAAGLAKTLKAELNYELGKVGESLLATTNMVRQWAVNVVRWFNNLSEGMQTSILRIGGVVAALGPATMFLGIFLNAAGQVVSVLMRLGRRMHFVTAAMAAQRIATDQATTAAGMESIAQKELTVQRLAAAAAADTNAAATARQTAAMAGTTVATGTSAVARGVSNLGVNGSKALSLGGASLGASAAPGGAGAGLAAVGGSMGKIGLAPFLAGIAKAAAGLLAVKAILFAIVAIPIAANFKDFVSGIKEVVSGPLESFKNAWAGLKEQVMRVVEIFRQSSDSESGGGLAMFAKLLGNIAGMVGGILISALSKLAGFFEVIAHIVEAIYHGFKAFANLFVEGEESAGALMEMFKALGRAVVGVVTMAMRSIADLIDAVSWLPGISDEWAESIHNAADALDDADMLQSSITDETLATGRAVREMEQSLEGFTQTADEARDILDGLEDIGVDIYNMTEDQVKANQNITDEMRMQIITAMRVLEIETMILAIREGQSDEGAPWMTDAQRASQEAARITHLIDSAGKVAETVREEFEGAAAATAWAGDEVDDLDDGMSDVNDETERLNDRMEEIKEQIRESEEAAKAWANALKSGVGEVMNDIVAAVEAALDEQERQMEEGFDARAEAIEDVEEDELERIEAIEKEEKELERARERWFEKQKARIEYIKGMEQANVKMDEAFARGDVAEASIIRIGLQQDAEAYMLDSYERERKAYEDTKQDEMEKAKEAAKTARDLALEQLEIERKAAQDAFQARRRSVELYLEDWQRITPATEAEFRRHLGALTGNMQTFGIRMVDIAGHYTQISGNNIYNGFADAIADATSAIAEDEKWEAAGRASGAQFRAGLAAEMLEIEGMLEDLQNGQDTDINTTFTATSGWENRVGGIVHSGTPYTRSGEVPNQTTTSFTPNYASSFGFGLPSPSSSPTSPGGGGGGTMLTLHSGGSFDTKPNMPGLKPDEQAYVLQRGEFVMQKDAVNKFGVDYMERVNQMKMHDGGLTSFGTSKVSEGGLLSPMAGYALGTLATLAAANIAKSNGVEPYIKKRDKSKRKGKEIGQDAGKQIRDVVSSFAVGQLGSGGEWERGSGGDWPRRQWAKISPNTAAAQRFFQAQGGFPGGIAASVHRGVEASDHSWGKALDFMVAKLGNFAQGSQKERGWQVANWHLQNPNAFGTKYVIWNGLINSDNRGWREYKSSRYNTRSATGGHYDHVHVSYLHDGGLVPSLQDGGKIRMDNTLVNTHKGERVLTEPSTKALESAIQNFANGQGGNNYELNITVNGGNMDEKKLAKTVMREIEMAEVRKGRNRVSA